MMHEELNPPISPNYAPPPWTYTKARIVNVVCRAANADALNRWVPAPLRPSRPDGLFVMFFLRVPSIPELGEHYHSTESGILIPAETEDGAAKGSTFAIMFVDNDVALAGGREIWGYPKKLGRVAFEEPEKNHIRAEASHFDFRDGKGGPIFSAEVELDGSHAELWQTVATLEPRLLRRAIPDPYAAAPQSVEVLKVEHTAGQVYGQATGRARVSLFDGPERLTEWGAVEALGATFRVCDFVLPYAKRLPRQG